jgi:hydrogenase expression/formation protein HypD
VRNFSLLVSQVLVPPAIAALLAAPDNSVQGFLAAGHVCAVMGIEEYLPLAAKFHVPIVVTGFEPVDLLHGVLTCVEQLEAGAAGVINAYARAVRPEGNRHAQRLMREVFTVVDREWRGLGIIPASGLGLRPELAEFDALARHGRPEPAAGGENRCRAGEVLRGKVTPDQCPAYGVDCTPEHPLGAPMVSGEGACAAYFRYRPR